jgi:hypothetical protein
MIVDGLAGNPGLGGDRVDARAGKPLTAKNAARRLKDLLTLGELAAGGGSGATERQRFCHGNKIVPVDGLDNIV